MYSGNKKKELLILEASESFLYQIFHLMTGILTPVKMTKQVFGEELLKLFLVLIFKLKMSRGLKKRLASSENKDF